MIDFEKIARVCHEANREYCRSIGERRQPEWDKWSAPLKNSVVEGVRFRLMNPGAPPRASHEAWFAYKQDEGWTYGAVKDEEAKTHPNMVPFDDLPPEQQMKDVLFAAIADRLLAGGEPEISGKKLGEVTIQAHQMLGVRGIIILTVSSPPPGTTPNGSGLAGSVGISGHGLNHAEATLLLASGIHLNLQDHDRHVLAGAAGRAAQAEAARIAADNDDGETDSTHDPALMNGGASA